MKLNTARIAVCVSLGLGTALSSLNVSAQSSDKEVQYSALLKQIEDTKLVIAQKQAYLSNQQSQIDSLKSQINGVPALKETVRPIVTNMVAEMEKVIKSDLPFLQQERLNRLDDLKEDMANAEIGESAIYRKAITMYDIEANYGNSVGSYTGPNPVEPGGRLGACQANLASTACSITDDLTDALSRGASLEDLAEQGSLDDGNYIHFGRLAFMYLEVDSSKGYRFDKDSNAWQELGSGQIIGLRRAVRIARGESAAGVVTAPVALDPAP